MFWIQASGNLENVKFSGKPMAKQPDGSWTLAVVVS